MQRVKIFGTVITKSGISINSLPPLLRAQGFLKERRQGQKVRGRGDRRHHRNKAVQLQQQQCTYKLKRLWPCMQELHESVSEVPSTEGRSGHVPPFLTQKLSPPNSHSQTKIRSLQLNIHGDLKTFSCY